MKGGRGEGWMEGWRRGAARDREGRKGVGVLLVFW